MLDFEGLTYCEFQHSGLTFKISSGELHKLQDRTEPKRKNKRQKLTESALHVKGNLHYERVPPNSQPTLHLHLLNVQSS
jgi:hypothetical protein